MTDHSDIPYCPIEPTPKQRLFIERQEQEVFFGGAAGGGKSVALLMAALLHVRQPGYAALILRKDLPRLGLPGGLIPRSHEWLAGSDAKWNQTRYQWRFPIDDGPPATITFGYLSRPLDKFRYASSEFQYIAFDELTDFNEEDYLFLFSRLRKTKSLDVPLRMRSASNPGGVGHLWVKRRFVEEKRTEDRDQSTEIEMGTSNAPLSSVLCPPSSPPEILCKQGRLFVPSRIADNPHLSADEYCESLRHLPTVERARLMNGDWEIQERNAIQAKWLRYYVELDDQLELLSPDGRVLGVVPKEVSYRFVTIDPAGTSAERTREAKGHAPSWSVLQVWDRPRREYSRYLLLRHQVRERFGFDELHSAILKLYDEWRPERLWIEGEKLGRAIVDCLKHELPIDCVATGRDDKVVRAGPLIVKFEQAEIFLPKHNTTWLPDLEAEMLCWTGDKRQVSDQIDAAAYAAIVAGRDALGSIRVLGGVTGA